VSGSALSTSTLVSGLVVIIVSMVPRLSSPPKCRSTTHTSGCSRRTASAVSGTVWVTAIV